ncbi:MAG: hypothetical protein ACLFTK_07475 [Anaerolineales bacterium]
MNLLAHLSYLLLLDWLFLQFLYVLANRYTVLNFHEIGFLPGRYILSGLVVGALVYWLYVIPVAILKRVWPGYWHPRWWLLWLPLLGISSAQALVITREATTPALALWVALALVVHLQVVHFFTLRVAERLARDERIVPLPGLGAAMAFNALWMYWVAYSFDVPATADPSPLIGTALERYILLLILAGSVVGLAAYRAGVGAPVFQDEDEFMPALPLSAHDIVSAFGQAWASFYLTVPVVHFMARGYVMSHGNLFPAFLLGLLVPLIWSLLLTGALLLVQKPELVRELRRARPRSFWEWR